MSPNPENTPTVAELLRQRGFMLLWGSRVTSTIGVQIQSVALGWQVYETARLTMSVSESAFWVGMMGLAAFVPVFLLALPAGETADRHDRKLVLLICYAGEIATAGLLVAASFYGFVSLPLLIGVAALFGVARAYTGPAGASLAPMLVPRPLLPRAIAWNSLAYTSGAVAGPAIGGLLLGLSPTVAYSATCVLYLVAALTLSLIRQNTKPEVQPGSRWALIKEGLAYVWGNKIVFGAISLDLFAVLLGGATALLPVFARDILHVGAQGFGLLRSAPAMGAALVAVVLATRPIRRHAGLFLLGGVALFGAATLVFGLSRSMPLSVLALAVLGGADMLSVFVRQTLVQLVTPDHMRGRVSAVSSLFIGASNELGDFESGIVARFVGPVGAALFGGAGSIAITVIWAKLFPGLRKFDTLG
ncbi:MFS transporter [Phenylobacterium sp.]|uniref:MFS transporter n=1 Tax=Phenylobacterium sp. TaxID=1871053 RepID=UPI002736E163|nr:MFS transporter [Phenylobacterium sp.]MDP3660387.1 MFS transporter [Phenylobacterium sp.]